MDAVEIGECGDYQNNSGHLSCSPRKIVPHGDKRRDNTNCRGGMQRINGIGKRGIHSLPEKLRHGHTHYEDAEREGYPPPPAGDAILVYILRCSEQTGKSWSMKQTGKGLPKNFLRFFLLMHSLRWF